MAFVLDRHRKRKNIAVKDSWKRTVDYGEKRKLQLVINFFYLGLDSPGQIAAVCKYAADNDYTIRAVGTGSSWSRLTHTRDILVVMTNLNKILELQPVTGSYNANEECVDVEVEAGKLVVDFVEELDKKHGLALNMMGNYAGQTVGDVANTSTHGSGIFSGTMVRYFSS